MASVYILHSNKLKRFYIGSCKDLKLRLEEHSLKSYKNSFTTRAEDWELFYFVDDLGNEQAKGIERHIKKMKSKKFIENLRNYPDIIKSLKLKYQ